MRISDWSSDVAPPILGFVREEDRSRMLAEDRAQLRQFGGIDLHPGCVTAEHHAIEPGAEVEEKSTGACDHFLQIGRATGRERVWQYGVLSGVAVSIKKKQVIN